MKFNKIITISLCALTAAFVAPTAAMAQSTAAIDSKTNNDSTSTGVGNAGSFGIGSGTADSLSTATATSNGVTDSHADSHNASLTGGTVTMSTASLSQAVSGIPTNSGYNVPDNWRTGDVNSASNSGSNGIMTNVANTGVSSNVGVVTSVTAGSIPAVPAP